MSDFGVLSLFPAVVVLIAVIWSRSVALSLFVGIFCWQLFKWSYNPFFAVYGTFESIVSTLAQTWVVKSLIFIVIIGSLLNLISKSGGVDAFVLYLTKKSQKIKSKRAALLLGYIVGILIFVESSITSLVVGAVTKPLAGRYGASSAKVAYLCDSTSAPVCSLIPLNGWGALIGGLISAQIAAGVLAGESTAILFDSLFFNFYSIVTLLFLLLLILTNMDFGPMKNSEIEAAHASAMGVVPSSKESDSPFLLLAPIVTLTLSALLFLYLSGSGDIAKGSGTTAIFYATIFTLFCMFVYLVVYKKLLSSKEYFFYFKAGSEGMFGIGLIMLFAFVFADGMKDMGAGAYLSRLAIEYANPLFLPVTIFLIGSLISFVTGTSWGTFGVMVPIALQVGTPFGIEPALLVGAAVSGGVFGDHCSPLSDTTIISATAAGCDIFEHIKTQLPYALFCAMIASVMYIIVGFY